MAKNVSYFVVNDLRHHVADGFEALGAALVGRVLKSVPVGVVEVNQVNGGDADGVERDVVVADALPVGLLGNCAA